MTPKPALPSIADPWGMRKQVGDLTAEKKTGLVHYVEFNLTGRCDAGCITCYSNQIYKDEPNGKNLPGLIRDLDEFKQICIKLKKWGLQVFTIYGREPLLWDRAASPQ
ncbi:MAG: hypothetical protein JXN60_09320, partial [Lentisphaerae bacterium]|nr:hypothetical protein [Lentisphaerota bacterium]